MLSSESFALLQSCGFQFCCTTLLQTWSKMDYNQPLWLMYRAHNTLHIQDYPKKSRLLHSETRYQTVRWQNTSWETLRVLYLQRKSPSDEYVSANYSYADQTVSIYVAAHISTTIVLQH